MFLLFGYEKLCFYKLRLYELQVIIF